MTAAPDLVKVWPEAMPSGWYQAFAKGIENGMALGFANKGCGTDVYKELRAYALRARLSAPAEGPTLQAEPSPDKMIADAIAGEPISMPIADIEMLLGFEESDSPIGNELISAQPVGPSPPDPEVERLMKLAREATPKGEPRDWYVVEPPWLPRDCEPYIIAGSPDPHAGRYVCDFVDSMTAGVEDAWTEEEWSSRNWALAAFIAACSPEVIIGLCTKLLAKPSPVEDAEADEIRKQNDKEKTLPYEAFPDGVCEYVHQIGVLLHALADRDTKLAAVTQELDTRNTMYDEERKLRLQYERALADAVTKFQNRVNEHTKWLQENAPHASVEQKHLDAHTPERAYWHYGYIVALRDVINALRPQDARSE